jgi:zinc transport system substrate-binding protein
MPRALLLSLLLAACTGAPPTPPGPAVDPLTVVALSTPVAWLATRIGGAEVVVSAFTPAGEDPPAWRPPADRIASLADADLILAHGAGYEAWVATATLPEARYVATADAQATIEAPGPTHSHGSEAAHSHAGRDPHTWSDPVRFQAQAAAVRDALTARDPAHAELFATRTATLDKELGDLHLRLQATLAPARGQPLAANHPAWRYLAERYNLDLRSFHLDPEGAPDPAEVEAVRAWTLTAGAAPVMWWEDPPNEAVRAALPAALRHVRIDPLEQPAEQGAYDYLAQAAANVVAFETLFAPPPP